MVSISLMSRSTKSQALSKLSSSQYVKKATKFIAPVLLSLVLLQNCSHLLPLIVDFSTTVIDKNYMFILCNGILALIAKSSGLIGSGENVPEAKGEAADFKPDMADKESIEVKEDGEAITEAVTEEAEKKDVSLITEELEVDEEEQKNAVVQDGEEEGIGLLSAEELQKKCEEFIRKMKSGIKFEAQQQQLIMVQ